MMIQEAAKSTDPIYNESFDQYGIPLSVGHSAQTDLPVWQYIHKLATPIPNPKSADRLFTHICVLCSASPPLRPTSKRVITWRNALMRQRMSTNAVAHLQRVHPDEFGAIAEYKQRKREALADKATKKEGQSHSKKAKITSIPKRKISVDRQVDVKQETESLDTALVPKTQRTTALSRKRKTTDLIKTWLISSGLPISVLQNEALQHLLKLATSLPSVLPTVLDLNAQVHEEFLTFRSLLESYLAFEYQAAMKLPFLSFHHAYRPMSGATAAHRVSSESNKMLGKAFFDVSVGFIDSRWRKVDLMLASRQVPNDWNEQLTERVIEIISTAYNIQPLSHYTRFHIGAVNNFAAEKEEDGHLIDDEDVLTHTLRHCVMNALEVSAESCLGEESTVRRVLRLLQELANSFKEPERASVIAESGGTSNFLSPAISVDTLALSSLTSIGAIAELLRVSCSRYHTYWQYYQSHDKLTDEIWTQLSLDDWHTVTEIEALLNHLVQFRLEERTPLRPGAVASSYVLLFRRLLSVTVNASSFKCFCLEDENTANLSPTTRSMRRKAKRVDTFTVAGRQCIERLKQLITQQFTTSDPSEVDDEIKAMLLDPRISAKAITLVNDTQVFHRAEEALRQEHLVVFQLLARPYGTSGCNEDDDEEDDEISSLLMVDGPKNQPAPTSPTNTERRSKDAVVEEEARAWQEWQQVYVAWDTIADKGADLFDKGQYNLLKLYHHVNILKWFRDVGQQTHPAAALLARIYLGKQLFSSPSSKLLMSRFMRQEEANWVDEVAQRAEKRCVLYHNWHHIQQLHAEVEPRPPTEEHVYTGIV
ncbi:hypothetical protein Plhal304r1_c008g0033351 [Plasmopara halstedii]